MGNDVENLPISFIYSTSESLGGNHEISTTCGFRFV
jgi:hypothetical protein